VELFELQNFPFDEQDLSICFHEENGIDQWIFVPEKRSEQPTPTDAWINVMQKHFCSTRMETWSCISRNIRNKW